MHLNILKIFCKNKCHNIITFKKTFQCIKYYHTFFRKIYTLYILYKRGIIKIELYFRVFC